MRAVIFELSRLGEAVLGPAKGRDGENHGIKPLVIPKFREVESDRRWTPPLVGRDLFEEPSKTSAQCCCGVASRRAMKQVPQPPALFPRLTANLSENPPQLPSGFCACTSHWRAFSSV